MADKYKILIVDDQEPNRTVLDNHMSALGHTSLQAENGVAALSLLETQKPDLILLDIMMPKMDGLQVLEYLKSDEVLRQIPVIMISALDDMESMVKCIQQGAVDYLVKPFNINLLKARIHSALADKRLRDQEVTYRIQIEEYTLKLEERVRERTKIIQDTRLEVVRRLGKAAEYRDNETGLHVIRMSHFSTILGRASGMNNNECELLLNASPMHDVGKIAIPDNVLLKPGKLDKDEWEIMKTHAALGAGILSGQNFGMLKLAETIALTHHEKWDGSGYPKGLSGEDIPIESRIVAIADVFDALTSVRPYKKAWSVEDAVKLIESESGKHFDPKLVPPFLKTLPEMIKIKEEFAEPTEKAKV